MSEQSDDPIHWMQELESPSYFLADRLSPGQLPLCSEKSRSKLLPQAVGDPSDFSKLLGASTNCSSRQLRKRMAGIESRKRKKQTLERLEETVKTLDSEVQYYSSQIFKVKDQLLKAVSNRNASEDTDTYAELECCLATDDPDLDRIDLLLDTLRYRIGADGKERQAKIDYYFKQIMHSLFPALHRYLMYAADHSIDIFAPEQKNEGLNLPWTRPLFGLLQLRPEQIANIARFKQQFLNKRELTLRDLSDLQRMKINLKAAEVTVENAMEDVRRRLGPQNSAHMILFCEKYKYRKEVSWVEFNEAEFAQQCSQSSAPRKRVKLG